MYNRKLKLSLVCTFMDPRPSAPMGGDRLSNALRELIGAEVFEELVSGEEDYSYDVLIMDVAPEELVSVVAVCEAFVGNKVRFALASKEAFLVHGRRLAESDDVKILPLFFWGESNIVEAKLNCSNADEISRS